MSKYFAYSPSCLLSVLLCTSFMLISCSLTSVPTTHPSLSDADSVTTWIRHNAIPLKASDAARPDTDLLPLEQLVGNASMVGLGEETHGTHEFFTMKARLTEFLITHMGFTTFIMENNWGMSQLIDDYINGGQEPIEQVMKGGLFRSWQTEEYRSMLEWMRAYNAAPTHNAKIHFLGMDCQGVSQSDFDVVENYLRTVDPPQVASVHTLYADIVTNSLPDWP